ncbi:Phosphatidylcholine/phosphatidylserine synthase [Candidatus Trichorickettsia mobilis]|jgi:CDP-diacylglycerol--serine O-phosphatidyltransferase|uniref:Phosphatidylcholine/phosphatidylserine synthase n=2 Tax=Candidatus Trichorickettsia mobilis TaxID=1346319 RepID=A0ABZ0URM8_9RICK|nr:Phosphatidylcholine/phosphatidylserine synthase [Candidatus Trichorickettsia mobilis]
MNNIERSLMKRVRISKPILFTKLIPNVITLLGLIVGVSSIRFALDSRWEIAVYCILIAGVLDGIDGRVARLLNATSPFGAELDSLCDFANFGVAPAIMIYLWSFQQYEFKLLSWFAMLLFVVCMAIRLARFNTMIFLAHDKQDKKSKYFSVGVPAPSGALLALIPMILDFEISTVLQINIRSHTILIDIYIAIVAVLLASRIPTFLLKNVHIKPEYLSLSMILSAIIIINIIIYPWYTLPIVAVSYLLSIPIAAIIARRM